MNSFKLSVTSFFIGIVLFFVGGVLSGCLDLPDKPQAIQPIDNASIFTIQQGHSDSTILKVDPTKSALLFVKISPESYLEELDIQWFHTDDTKDTLLRVGDTIFIPEIPTNIDIPTRVVITDKAKNQLTKEIDLILDTPPFFEDFSKPANGDTIYATPSTAIEFKWSSYDLDLTHGDKLTHILEIDDVPYKVGGLNKIEQSGFATGAHNFRVIVIDSYASSDTLPMQKFYVIDTTGGNEK